MDTTIERLRCLVEANCRAIVDDEHPIHVEAIGGAENLLFEVQCDPGDVGLLIGRNGRNIEAIRTLVRSACRGQPIRTSVEVLHSRR
jgi:predicted RNA-binding protein YlqC (UPF0109 family)